MTPTIKAGYRTTEFWITVLTALVGLAVSLGYLTPEHANALLPSIGLAAMVIAGAAYAISRGIAKAGLPGAQMVVPAAQVAAAAAAAAVPVHTDPAAAPAAPRAPPQG